MSWPRKPKCLLLGCHAVWRSIANNIEQIRLDSFLLLHKHADVLCLHEQSIFELLKSLTVICHLIVYENFSEEINFILGEVCFFCAFCFYLFFIACSCLIDLYIIDLSSHSIQRRQSKYSPRACFYLFMSLATFNQHKHQIGHLI